jgi:methyl-accepting chemotaxis protein
VVADEVRKLAERSRLATGEIAQLVKGIRETVADSVTSADRAAQEMGQISGELARTIASVSEGVVTNRQAGQRLSTGAADVTQAVENSAAVEEVRQLRARFIER